MRLRINSLAPTDYGVYKCISKNSLGDMEGSINVYSKYYFVFILKLYLQLFKGIYLCAK